jgi:hypothetical protein
MRVLVRPDNREYHIGRLIRILIDQNPFAHSLRPMDMMRHGWLSSLRQASHPCATMSS